jgi:hypothetical protein
LRALDPTTSDENEILPREEGTGFDALHKPLGPHDFHVFELADLGRCQGTSDNVSAMYSDYSKEVNMTFGPHYAHKRLLIDIGMVDPTMLHDHSTQFLNRGLCPTIDLTHLSTRPMGYKKVDLREWKAR